MNVNHKWTQFMYPVPCTVLNFPVLIPHNFGLLLLPTNPRKTEIQYFENKTQQRENSAKPVTNNSIFPVYDLF